MKIGSADARPNGGTPPLVCETNPDSLLWLALLIHDHMVMYSALVRFAISKFGDVAIRSAGSGPPVVLLHANGGSHHDFDAVICSLVKHATVFAVDWPGHGDSGLVTEPGACAFADLLPRILESLGHGPYTLIGNSVGGFAAIRTAARHPHLVSNLVLVNPGGFTPRWPTTFLACRLFGWDRFAPSVMRLLPRLYLRRRTANVDAILTAVAIASQSEAQSQTFAKVWRSFTDKNHSAPPDAVNIDVPVLIVWGTHDPVLPWLIDGRRARKSLRHAQVVKMQCGHQAFAEMPEQFMGTLREFLGWKEEVPS
jgi:pimeloyl-ACP methyl ester carboxylesterase